MSYEKNKKHILKYFKTSEKYKAYKKEYDSDYFEQNKCYATFRSLKSKYSKKCPLEVNDRLYLWAEKRKDICEKTRNKIKEL